MVENFHSRGGRAMENRVTVEAKTIIDLLATIDNRRNIAYNKVNEMVKKAKLTKTEINKNGKN